MESVIISSSAFHAPASSTNSAKPARSYSSPKGAAAVKMAIKTSMLKKLGIRQIGWLGFVRNQKLLSDE